MSAHSRFEILLLLLAVAVVLEALAARLRLSRASTLIVGGIAIALVPGLPDLSVDPDLFLVAVLPPLLLSSAYFTVWSDFRANFRIIMQLATGAVVLTTVAVAVTTHWLKPDLPWAACFALGAILSPPDAVSAKAVLKRFPLPRRMLVLLEGESLVNDASGLVLLRFAVIAAMTGTFNAGTASLTFVYVALMGVAIGVALGYLAGHLLRLLADTRLIVLSTFLLAWGSYLLGEWAGASGVLATVACGIVLGHQQHRILSAATRTQARAVWNVAEFLLESLVFMLIGLSVRKVVVHMDGGWHAALALLPAALVIFITLIVSRAAWVFPATYIPRALLPRMRERDPFPPVTIPALVSWAGMRGGVSLAAALSLPNAFPGRDIILVVTFVTIAGTIFVLGGTLAPLAKSIAGREFVLEQKRTLTEAELRRDLSEAELEAIRTHVQASDDPHAGRLIARYEWRAELARMPSNAGDTAPHTTRSGHAQATLLAVAAARTRLLHLYKEGRVHDSLLHQFEEELDLEELHAQKGARGTAY